MPSNSSASGSHINNRVGDAAAAREENQCPQCCSIPSFLVDDEEDDPRIISYVVAGNDSVADTGHGDLTVARPVVIKDPSLAQVQRIGITPLSAEPISSNVRREQEHDMKASNKKKKRKKKRSKLRPGPLLPRASKIWNWIRPSSSKGKSSSSISPGKNVSLLRRLKIPNRTKSTDGERRVGGRRQRQRQRQRQAGIISRRRMDRTEDGGLSIINDSAASHSYAIDNDSGALLVEEQRGSFTRRHSF
jgi:hypothetical protein